MLGLLADALPVALFILVASAILPINTNQISAITWVKLFDVLPIFSNKYHIYESPQEVPHDFRPRILGNLKILGKSQNFLE